MVINDFMADNDTVIIGQDGEFDDYLSNDGKKSDAVGFPRHRDRCQWLIDHLDDDDGPSSGLHANFKLSKSGEAIYFQPTSS